MDIKTKIYETLSLLEKLWILVLIAIYFACFMNEYHFPGIREEPLEGETIYWKIQRVLFFGLIGLGFLADIVQMQLERKKAYFYLSMSLILGGISGFVAVYQYKLMATIFGKL